MVDLVFTENVSGLFLFEEVWLYDVDRGGAESEYQLISGVNFTNVLCTAFTLVDPESVKKYS